MVGRRRMDADRYRRIWQIVEWVAAEPGLSRRQLAQRCSLSERQIQDDLTAIRVELALPLVRRSGYRFVEEHGAPASTFSLAEAQVLLLLLRRAALDPAVSGRRVRAVLGKVPDLFPPYLRPLVEKTLQATRGEGLNGPLPEVIATLADALLDASYVKLHYVHGEGTTGLKEPAVLPEVLLPHQGSWYVIGPCRQRKRRLAFDLDGVVAVTRDTGL